jgi:hypothetical protein
MAFPEQIDLNALAHQVAELLTRSSASMAVGLLTARQVAARFNVDRGWVYAHADELGVIRLGQGPRPRLRFDPAVVAQRLVSRPASTVPARRPTRPGSATPLLPINPSRPRRSLDM